MRRTQPRRDWTEAIAKVHDEGACRACGRGMGEVKIEAAHLTERRYDKRSGYYVKPARIVPLCVDCHRIYDGPASDRGSLQMQAVINAEETEQMVEDLGSLALAWRRLTGTVMTD